MTHVTVLLLVLTLTGAPVANVACIAVCQHARGMAGHCHSDETGGGPLLTTDVVCTELSLGESQYVAEHRVDAPGQPLETPPGVAPAAPLVRAPFAAISATVAGVRLKLPLVLRI